jgi:hypothetical protein
MNVLLFLDVTIIDSGLNNVVKGGGLFLSSVGFKNCIEINNKNWGDQDVDGRIILK